jgi:hypothetical protein
VILRRGERQHVAAVDHDDEARFLAFQEVLDHHARTCCAHRVVDEHRVDRGVGFGLRLRDDDAPCGGEPVRLDHDGHAALRDVRVRLACIGERSIPGGRQPMPLHERLGEILGAFELRRGARRAEDGEVRFAKRIDDARGQRCLGTDGRSRQSRICARRPRARQCP